MECNSIVELKDDNRTRRMQTIVELKSDNRTRRMQTIIELIGEVHLYVMHLVLYADVIQEPILSLVYNTTTGAEIGENVENVEGTAKIEICDNVVNARDKGIIETKYDGVSLEEDLKSLNNDEDAIELFMFAEKNNSEVEIFIKSKLSTGGTMFINMVREKNKGKKCDEDVDHSSESSDELVNVNSGNHKRQTVLGLRCSSNFVYSRRRKKTVKAVIQIHPQVHFANQGDAIGNVDSIFQFNSNSIPRRPRTKCKPKLKGGEALVRSKEKLNSQVFHNYLAKIWKSFSKDRKMSFAYLDSLWFSLYRSASTRDKVLSWINKERIFTKAYVFVPIVCWGHWNLLIFCHFGENLQSVTESRCMLLLDSLEMANPRRLEPEIRRFVQDIYKAGDRPETKRLISQIPLLVPKVPQQKDGTECGNFVLYFIKLFLEFAPDKFNIEGYPYFMKKDWFTFEELERFCESLTH